MQEMSKYKKFNKNVARGSLSIGSDYTNPMGGRIRITGRHGKKWQGLMQANGGIFYGCYWPSELTAV